MMKQVKEDEILWAKLKGDTIIPTKENENAGYDIYANFDEDFIMIPKNNTVLIPTKLACALNKKYYLQLEERGSTGSKGMKRSAGVIDSGYRGEIFVALTNCSNANILISKIDKEEILQKYPFETNSFNDKQAERRMFSVYNAGYFIDNVIIYSYSKAICQGIIHKVPQLESKEVLYEELCEYTSERGKSNLGSSKK